jgi:putative secretion ATPase (PEP-CTERM system associated)
MHLNFYQLSADPFRLSPDPRFCFPHRSYHRAMIYMQHALQRAEGFIVITGEPGMGKTTLINDLLRGLKTDQIRVARLVSTQLAADDLLRLVAYTFELGPEGMSKAALLNRIGRFLEQQHLSGRRALLIVDEAQDLPEEALEELRLLMNIQVQGHQLLQIFLVGQKELRELVSAPSLEQLHQRVIAATYLEPLNATETKEYIKHRLRRVGWAGRPMLSNPIYEMIHQFSRGIPRQINQICSRLLLHGSIEERDRLGLQDLKIVIEELHGEMLLPLGMQEIAGHVVWPENLAQESYDDPPRPAPAPPSSPADAEADMLATRLL